jgi:hypothetical protein
VKHGFEHPRPTTQRRGPFSAHRARATMTQLYSWVMSGADLWTQNPRPAGQTDSKIHHSQK